MIDRLAHDLDAPRWAAHALVHGLLLPVYMVSAACAVEWLSLNSSLWNRAVALVELHVTGSLPKVETETPVEKDFTQ